MIRCAISLGGNLGDIAATFDRACGSLTAHPLIVNFAVSRRYRTAPMGVDAGAEFLNAAAMFETKLDPEPLLDLLQQIEHDQGRVRAVHWGPRTLDLDLLLYGDQIIHSPRLSVPHPALWHRRFVLDPLCEVMSDAIHPAFGITMSEVRARLLPRPLPVYFLPSVGWAVPTTSNDQIQLVGTAQPTEQQAVAQTFLSVRTDRNVCATEDSDLAAIVFASSDDHAPWPHVVHLPGEKPAAIQLVRDVLTAALDEPFAA